MIMEKDILEEIVAWKRAEVAQRKATTTEHDIHAQVERLATGTQPSLREALTRPGSSGIIAEFKRRSPSKGWIRQDADPAVIPIAYQQNGAAALSILADERFFGGSGEHIRTARAAGVTIPILYKEFVVDEYQLFEAALNGASAVLLIAAVLTKNDCRTMTRTAHDIGLEVLLEMHSEQETDYADIQPDVCGINNRNLGTFVTDVNNSLRLATRLPADAVKVSESGIAAATTIRTLRAGGYHGFLIGETFMRAPSPGDALNELIRQTQ